MSLHAPRNGSATSLPLPDANMVTIEDSPDRQQSLTTVTQTQPSSNPMLPPLASSEIPLESIQFPGLRTVPSSQPSTTQVITAPSSELSFSETSLARPTQPTQWTQGPYGPVIKHRQMASLNHRGESCMVEYREVTQAASSSQDDQTEIDRLRQQVAQQQLMLQKQSVCLAQKI